MFHVLVVCVYLSLEYVSGRQVSFLPNQIRLLNNRLDLLSEDQRRPLPHINNETWIKAIHTVPTESFDVPGKQDDFLSDQEANRQKDFKLLSSERPLELPSSYEQTWQNQSPKVFARRIRTEQKQTFENTTRNASAPTQFNSFVRRQAQLFNTPPHFELSKVHPTMSHLSTDGVTISSKLNIAAKDRNSPNEKAKERQKEIYASEVAIVICCLASMLLFAYVIYYWKKRKDSNRQNPTYLDQSASNNLQNNV